MSDPSQELECLRAENARLRDYIDSLKALSVHEHGNGAAEDTGTATSAAPAASGMASRPWDGLGHGLNANQVSRYSRQIILPSFGVESQALLCRGSVLIVGAGGLGSPAAIYLAAAGVGRLGIVDRDTVELSNIHRQVIHSEGSVGRHKADSAAAALTSLNSSIAVETHKDGLTPANAVDLVSGYDVVVDASDNAPTRYLLSDACAATGRPLVSGAAIGTDGQLTVYCYGEDGPCYRCLFPTAPAAANCARCVDAGVLGVVPGIIGTMQALEAIKILTKIGTPMSRKLMVMDALSSRYHVVTLRARSPGCVACGASPSITAASIPSYDYAGFTGQAPHDAPAPPLALISPRERLSAAEVRDRLAGAGAVGAVVVDVRPAEQYAICHLPGSINAPMPQFSKHLDAIRAAVDGSSGEGHKELYVVCRRGNQSQKAVLALREAGMGHAVDMVGGVAAWAAAVDPTFPVY